jgi:NAD(P)-dependent dehydrogenase (short-subunit alcohol dehydrogenase family)
VNLDKANKENTIMARLLGKTAFISGAGAGIGRAAALLFAREGARVAIAELNGDSAAAVAAEIAAFGGEALAIPTDVTDEASVQSAVARTVAEFGRLDVLFNCAGGSLTADTAITEVDLARVWNHTMPLDLLGTMHCCRHAIPAIIAAGGGAVVNMSSGAALRGSSPGHVYTAAKGAIVSLTRALAGTYAKRGVRVNAICAGRILTGRVLRSYGSPAQAGAMADPQNAAGRIKEYPLWVGTPEDIANIALFLAADESRMITGASIPADGGRSAY